MPRQEPKVPLDLQETLDNITPQMTLPGKLEGGLPKDKPTCLSCGEYLSQDMYAMDEDDSLAGIYYSCQNVGNEHDEVIIFLYDPLSEKLYYKRDAPEGPVESGPVIDLSLELEE